GQKPKQKAIRKLLGIVAVFMTVGVIVHANPMAWSHVHLFMTSVHTEYIQGSCFKVVTAARMKAVHFHWWRFADPQPVVLQERPVRLQKLQQHQMSAPIVLPASNQTLWDRKSAPKAILSPVGKNPHHPS